MSELGYLTLGLGLLAVYPAVMAAVPRLGDARGADVLVLSGPIRGPVRGAAALPRHNLAAGQMTRKT